MFCSKDIQRIIKYFLFTILTLSPQCFAAVKTELNEDNHAEHSLKSFRRLQYSWDDDNFKINNDDDSSFGRKKSVDDGMIIFLIIFYVIVFTVVAIFQCCKKYCNEFGDDYADAIVHPPPRSSRIAHVPSNRCARNFHTRELNPARANASIILPHGASAITLEFTGTENPTGGLSFSNISSVSASSVNRFKTANPTPLLDIPPPYEAVVRDENPSTTSERRFPVVFEDSPPQYSNILK